MYSVPWDSGPLDEKLVDSVIGLMVNIIKVKDVIASMKEEKDTLVDATRVLDNVVTERRNKGWQCRYIMGLAVTAELWD